MNNSSIRLVGITGLGGYGKSTLAAKFLKESEKEGGFTRLLWIKISQLYQFVVWGQELLKLLGQVVDENIGEEELIYAVIHNLSQQRYLIVIDNLELLLTGNRQWHDEAYHRFLLQWLQYGTNSILLCTSRERPEIPVNMLSRCKWLEGLAGLSSTEGESLLRGLGIQGDSLEIQSVVRQADGHPLLLELLAGTLIDDEENELHIGDIKQDLLRLVGLHQSNQEMSVEKILVWSLERLDPQLQKLVLNLSVYRPAFNLAAAKVMLAEVEITEKHLRDLARRSLLKANKEQGNWKFQFLPLVQQYFQRRLNQQAKEAHYRAIDYYRSVSKSIIDNLNDFETYQEIHYHYIELGEYAQALRTLRNCDDFFDSQGHFNLEISLYERLLEKWKPSIDKEEPDFSVILVRLGVAYSRLGQLSKASKLFQESYEAISKLNNPYVEAETLYGLALSFTHFNQAWDSIETQKKALKLISGASNLENKKLEVNCLIALASRYYNLGMYVDSINYYRKALSLSRENKYVSGEGNCLIGMAQHFYYIKDDKESAREYINEAIKLFQLTKNHIGEGYTISILGLFSYSEKEYTLAIQYYNQAIHILEKAESLLLKGHYLCSLSICSRHLKKYQESINFCIEAKAIAKEFNNSILDAFASKELAQIYELLDNPERAIEHLKSFIEIIDEFNFSEDQAFAWLDLGDILKSIGLKNEAIEAYEKASEILPKVYSSEYNNRIAVNRKKGFDTLSQIAKRKAKRLRRKNQLSIENFVSTLVADRLLIKKENKENIDWLEIEAAIDYYQAWLSLARNAIKPKAEAICLRYIGTVLFAANQFQPAIDYYKQALIIQRETQDFQGIFETFDCMSLLYDFSKEYEKLLDCYQQSLQYAQQIEDTWREAASWLNVGVALEKLNRQSDAVEAYKRSHTMFQAIGNDEEDYIEILSTAIQTRNFKNLPLPLRVMVVLLMKLL